MPSKGSRWGLGLIVAGGLLFGLAMGGLILFSAPAAKVAGPTPLSSSLIQVSQRAAPVAPPPPAVGAPASDFSLADLSGQAVKLSDFTGQVVVLNFWATWCGPCQVEMPTIEKYYEGWKGQGLAVLAVEVGDPLPDVKTFVNDHHLTFTVAWDEKFTVSDMYRVSALPTTFVLDRQGKITQQHLGMMSDSDLEGFLVEAGLKKP